jgi:ligand-binding SRPBCC domain-containing protein
MILNRNDSNPAIYNVGPFKSPLTDNSTNLVSISQTGWGEVRVVDGVKTQVVLPENDSSRLYVATSSLMSVNITYLDVGEGPISINVHNFDQKNWTNGYTTIQRNNTGNWTSFGFILPPNEEGYAELGLHAFDENFTVSNIEVAPYQSMERPVLSSVNSTIINCTLNMNLTRTTRPESLMFYLPIPNGTQSVSIQTSSYGKQTGIEIYDGIIQPSESTNWWARHSFVTRSPASVIYGTLNPSINWQPEKSGYYTVVVVLREYWKENPRMELTVSTVIVNNATVTAQTAGTGRNALK